VVGFLEDIQRIRSTSCEIVVNFNKKAQLSLTNPRDAV